MAHIDVDKIVSKNAVMAVQAYLGCDEATAIEVVDVVKPHLNHTLRVELANALSEVDSLTKS